jgi:hypothetical protein
MADKARNVSGSARAQQLWREQVGEHIERRRIQLGFPSIRAAARAAGVSEGVWRQLESGRRAVGGGRAVAPRPTARICARVATTLRWPQDAIDQLAAGRKPKKSWAAAPASVRSSTPGPAATTEGARTDELREVLVRVARATPSEITEVATLLRTLQG